MVIKSTRAHARYVSTPLIGTLVGVTLVFTACHPSAVRQVGPSATDIPPEAQGPDASARQGVPDASAREVVPDALPGEAADPVADLCARAPDDSATCEPNPKQATPVVREIPRRPTAGTFEVDSTSALIWAHSPVSTRARLDVQRAHSNRPGVAKRYLRVEKHYMKLPAEHGNTGVFLLNKLLPDQVYRYRVQTADGDGTDWFHLRTAPADDADVPVHFVFGAEFSNDPRFFSPLLANMARSGAAFFISLGDWPYTDLPVQDRTVADYRASHRLARALPETQRLLQALPLYAIYDDHDIKNDWDISLIEESPHRARAALQVWDEYFPVRDRRPDVMERKRYRTWRWGKHAQFFMLDTRRYRSFFRDEDTGKKAMLGEVQLAWLKRELGKSDATFKFILSTVPFDFGTTREHWRAYRFARKKLYDFLRDQRISGVVFLTGDQHWLSIHDLDTGHREYQVGPLQSFLRKPPEERPDDVLFELAVQNYGEIMITSGKDPRLVFTARGENGELLYVDTLAPMVPAPADSAASKAGDKKSASRKIGKQVEE